MDLPDLTNPATTHNPKNTFATNPDMLPLAVILIPVPVNTYPIFDILDSYSQNRAMFGLLLQYSFCGNIPKALYNRGELWAM